MSGMCNTKNLEATERLGISAPEVGDLLGVSKRHIWGLNASGRLPSPVRLGRAVRWDRAEIAAWFAAGAPPRDEWEQIKAQTSGGQP